MSKINILLVAIFIISAVSCSQRDSMEYETIETSVNSFEKVHLTGGGRMHLIPSDHYLVEIKGQGASSTEVKTNGNILYLTNDSRSGRQDVDIYIYTPTVTGVQITGGGMVEIEDGFSAVERFDCTIQGGGKLTLEALEIGFLDISILGGGTVTAQVEDVINANILGGGSIQYLGNPEVKSSIMGGGSIKRKNM